MKVEAIPEDIMHLGYLFFARDNDIKRTEKREEEEKIGAVKSIESSPAERGINKDYKESLWLGKYVDISA